MGAHRGLALTVASPALLTTELSGYFSLPIILLRKMISIFPRAVEWLDIHRELLPGYLVSF